MKRRMLLNRYQYDLLEAGCDEAGRGCLAGPVFAAAVILPEDFSHPELTDSKKMTKAKRHHLREIIESQAISFAVSQVNVEEIDRINILNASLLAMHKALDQLTRRPEYIIIDGNRFHAYRNLPYRCIVEGDGKYLSIAAASVLAKTYRDDYMESLASHYPQYEWQNNKGYGTVKHRIALRTYGTTPHHRKTFRLKTTDALFL